jgi:electron transport complex protein RnfB
MTGSAADRAAESLADAIDRALPQTQCTRCGYPDCRRYAEAVATGEAAINRCPPGGAEGVARLARLTDQPNTPLDPDCGVEAPRALALIDEAACIGCTLCIAPCPVDCIVGAPKAMHRVIDEFCTGCALCLPACPVDCISLVPVTGELTGWQAWTPDQAETARERYGFHQFRQARDEPPSLRPAPMSTTSCEAIGHGTAQDATGSLNDAGTPDALSPEHKRALIDAALLRARAARAPR